MVSVTCACCGEIYDAGLEACPRRYLSDHTTDFAAAVALRLLGHNAAQATRRQLHVAIQSERDHRAGHLPGVPS